MYYAAGTLKARLCQLSKEDWKPLFQYLEQLQTPEMQGVDRHSESPSNMRIRQLKLMLDRMEFWAECKWRDWPLGESIFRGDASELEKLNPAQLCKFLTALFQNQTSGGEALNIAFENGTVLRVVQALATHARKSRRR